MKENKAFLLLFSFIIASVLLFLYAGTIVYLVLEVLSNCSCKTCNIDEKGVSFVVTTVGGLISALVIARLSLTSPGDTPAILNLATLKSERWKKLAPKLEIAYLLIWLLAGLAALLIGTMFCPDKSEVLSNIGTNWIGLATAAAYAYFGIEQTNS